MSISGPSYAIEVINASQKYELSCIKILLPTVHTRTVSHSSTSTNSKRSSTKAAVQVTRRANADQPALFGRSFNHVQRV